MIKLIVSDMDGTLITHQGRISKGNLEAIHHGQKHGARLVIATGRDFSSIDKIMHDHGLSCMAILGNGAQFANQNGEVLSSAYFPKKQFKEVIKIFDDLNIYYMIFTTAGFYTTHDPEAVKNAFIERCCQQFHHTRDEYDDDMDMPCMQLQRIEDVNGFLKSDIDIIKVEAFSLNIRLIEKAKEKLKAIDDIAFLSSFNDNVEVTDYHAQKGLILEKVIERLNIAKDEVMVLGDGYNDITMFEKFPYSFAPENAEAGIKELAYQVVASCENDGVAEAIYMMIPKGK